MPLGLLTGLGAALAWGTLDIFSALASRRVGSLKVTTGIQIVGATIVLALALVTGTPFPTDPAVLLGGSLVGLAGAGAYLAYFTGLRIGPIAVVSGMVAAYGGLTVVLAVVIRGETLTLAPGGRCRGRDRRRHPHRRSRSTAAARARRLASPGVVFAIVALILFAIDVDRHRHRHRPLQLDRCPDRLADRERHRVACSSWRSR